MVQLINYSFVYYEINFYLTTNNIDIHNEGKKN